MNIIWTILIFYTRLPVGKYVRIPDHYFRNIMHYWPLAGWLTASVMAAVLMMSTQIFPYSVAVILAIISRLLLTGALHEDGLADFADGFGAGQDKAQILRIMKDSYIGTYGVLALILYFLLLYMLLSSLPPRIACLAILAADPFCKGIASLLSLFLPYARKIEESKYHIALKRMDKQALVIMLLASLLPLTLFLPVQYWVTIFFVMVVAWLFICWLKRKIGGYTGDCAGALFLILELTFYLSFSGLYTHYGTLFNTSYFG